MNEILSYDKSVIIKSAYTITLCYLDKYNANQELYNLLDKVNDFLNDKTNINQMRKYAFDVHKLAKIYKGANTYLARLVGHTLACAHVKTHIKSVLFYLKKIINDNTIYQEELHKLKTLLKETR